MTAQQLPSLQGEGLGVGSLTFLHNRIYNPLPPPCRPTGMTAQLLPSLKRRGVKLDLRTKEGSKDYRWSPKRLKAQKEIKKNVA